MDGTFVRELKQICENDNHIGEVITINGHSFLYNGREFNEIDDVRIDRPSMLELTDLTSFATIINEEANRLGKKMFIKIMNENEVICLSTWDDKYQRDIPYKAVNTQPRLRLWEWQSYEDFVIGLRAKFEPTEDREAIIKMIANIVNCDNQELIDDGITQTVKTQRGTQIGEREVKSIVELKPYRTFPECEQPTSQFLFRITNNGTRFGLFEADGDKWVLDAKKSIKNFLSTAIKNENVIILM